MAEDVEHIIGSPFIMHEASSLQTLTICEGRATWWREEEAKDDLIVVRSHGTHSGTGRPAVNSPATHGPV